MTGGRSFGGRRQQGWWEFVPLLRSEIIVDARLLVQLQLQLPRQIRSILLQ